MKTSYSFGKEFMVDNAEFLCGKITGIIGQNGSGKTTLLKAIAGLMPYRGSILVDGRQCREYSGMERAQIVSYLPQAVKAVSLDVKTLVQHGRFPWHGNLRKLSLDDERFVDEALEMAAVGDLAERNLNELSGGQLRRAYMAMMFAQNAKMMMLDEPTTYMDLKCRAMLCDILKKYVQKGHGVIMTCHGIDQAFSLCDTIVIMDDRKLVKIADPDEMCDEEELLRSIFGVAVKRTDDKDLMYPYQLVK